MQYITFTPVEFLASFPDPPCVCPVEKIGRRERKEMGLQASIAEECGEFQIHTQG